MKENLFALSLIILSCSLLDCVRDPVSNLVETNNLSFSETSPSEIIHLELEKLINNRKELFLSDFAEDISYIPLETTGDYLIGDKEVRLYLTGSSILINENGKPIGLFDRSGKFIRQIGSVGRGPGEYDGDANFRVDSELEKIYIWNASKGSIMCFDLNGNMLGEMKIPFRISSFSYAGNNLFCSTIFPNRNMIETSSPKFILFDNNGNIVNRIYGFSPDPLRMSGLVYFSEPSFLEAPEGLIIDTHENDSLYKVFPDSSCRVVVSWDAGKYRMPFDPYVDIQRFRRERNRYIIDFNGMESDSSWFFNYWYGGEFNMAIYNKSSKEFTVVSNPDKNHYGLQNDFDGGPAFFPSEFVISGHTFLRLLYPDQLKKMMQDGKFSQVGIKYPERNRLLKELINDLDENDNPVLMIVKLK